MKNPTILLVFLLSCAAARLHCAAARLHCALARLPCAAARLHCAAARLHCAAVRFHCAVARKMFAKNNHFSFKILYNFYIESSTCLCPVSWALCPVSWAGSSKKIFCRVCIFPQGPFFWRKKRFL